MSRRGNGQVWDPAPTPGVGMDDGETETEGVEVPDSRLSPLPPPPPAPPLDGKDLSASPDHMNSSPGSSPSTYTANEPSAPGQASPRVVVTPDVGAQAGVGAKGDVHPPSPRSQRVQRSPSSRRGGGSTNIDRASFLSLSLSTSVSEEPTENSGRDDASSGSVQTRSFDDLPQIDELILEYLLFRGFTQSFHTFTAERKSDHLLGFNVTRIVDRLFAYVEEFNMPGLLSLWSFLNARFFYHLEPDYRTVVVEYETALKHYYIVHAIKTNQPDKAVQFFKEYGKELVGKQWEGWFALPFMHSKGTLSQGNSQFNMFFKPEWPHRLAISLKNFLNLILQNIPMPKLMGFNIGRIQQHEQECVIESQKSEIRLLKRQLAVAQRGDDASVPHAPKRTPRESSTEDEDTSALFSDALSFEQPVRRSSVDSDGGEHGGGELTHGAMNTKEYDIVATETLMGHNDAVLCCKLSADGAYLASGGMDSTVRIWSLKYWQDSLHILGADLCEHEKFGTSDAARSPRFRNGVHGLRGNLPESATDSKFVQCHNTIYLGAEALSMDWSPTRQKPSILFGTANGEVKLWDVAQQGLMAEFRTDVAHPIVQCAQFCPDGRHLITSASSGANHEVTGALQLWDVNRRQHVKSLPIGRTPATVNAIDFHPLGTLMVTGCSDGMVRVYDLGAGMLVQRWHAHDGHVRAVKFTKPNGGVSSVLSAGTDGRMVEWSLAASAAAVSRQYIMSAMPAHPRAYERSMVYNKERDHIAAGSAHGAAVLYRIARQTPVQYIDGHDQSVLSIAWETAPGCPLSTIATGSTDQTVKLWALRRVRDGSGVFASGGS